MRFCPHCGAPLMAGAKFCIECGRQLAEAASPAASPKGSKAEGASGSTKNWPRLTTTFTAVFFGIVIVGLAATVLILTRPIPQPPLPQGQGSSATQTGQQGASGQGAGDLPPGHPKVELPTEARTFIDKVEQEAKAKPNDVAAWVKLGTVSMRAALFDESYYDKATSAFSRVLKLDPENLDALRGIGDIDYDNKKYDQAIAAYEHYLKRKPDDPEVIVDLGTMYLYTGNADQAVAQYKKAIGIKPDFFQAYYNLGVAYDQQGDKKNAAAELTKAISLAPDDARRKQAKDLLTRVTGVPADQSMKTASSAPSTGAQPQPPPTGAVAAKGGTFQHTLERMMRNLPLVGDKVDEVRWSGDYKAEVWMDDFPMNSMPPFAKEKFLNDVKAGIESAKTAHKVAGKVEVDIVDGQTGRIMQTVTE